MSYIALYRKYRPKVFDEIVGQTKNIVTIKNAIINNKISHAYLFCGSRGTGKTSTAKVIAKTVNCLNLHEGIPCEKCENCQLINNNMCEDIVEMDAASNNGVDEIREIRDKISLVPSKLKYKVYIIDEVHMLTSGAFNALLKTLEEPPSHVIFILATTESHKIPVTISSRCQKFTFEKLADEFLVEKLRFIAAKENCIVNDECLFAMAKASDGAMRDAIGLLDQLITYCNGNITIDDVCNVAGVVSREEVINFLLDVLKHDDKQLLNILDNISTCGKNITKFIEEVMYHLKEILLCKRLDNNKEMYSKILSIITVEKIYLMLKEFNKLLMEIKFSSNQMLLLTVCVLQLADSINCTDNDDKNALMTSLENNSDLKNTAVDKMLVGTESNNIIIDNVEKIKKTRINNAFALADKKLLTNLKEQWGSLESYLLDKKYGVIAGLLMDSTVVVVSERNIVVTNKSKSVVGRINSLLDLASELCFNIFNNKHDLIALDNDEWKNEKQIYVNNYKNKVEYKYIDEDVFNNKLENVSHNDVSELIDMFGTDIIEYK